MIENAEDNEIKVGNSNEDQAASLDQSQSVPTKPMVKRLETTDSPEMKSPFGLQQMRQSQEYEDNELKRGPTIQTTDCEEVSPMHAEADQQAFGEGDQTKPSVASPNIGKSAPDE